MVVIHVSERNKHSGVALPHILSWRLVARAQISTASRLRGIVALFQDQLYKFMRLPKSKRKAHDKLCQYEARKNVGSDSQEHT